MQPAHALKRYTDALRTIQAQAQATDELSYHHALLQLLRELDPTAEFIHEPKRVVVGRPDFVLLKNGAPAGYIEAEAFDADLDRLTGHAKAQTDAFKQNLDNFLLTNFVEFRLYRAGECVMSARLDANLSFRAERGIPSSPAADSSPSARNDKEVEALLLTFLAAQPLPIRTPHELALHLARRTRQLKHALHATLEVQLQQPPDAPLELRSLYRAFQETLLPDLTPDEFADLYAQTIAYGLFAARSTLTPLAPLSADGEGGSPATQHFDSPSPFTERGSGGEGFSRHHAAQLIPPTNPFLRRLFQQLAAHDLEPQLAWIADDLAQLLHHADMPSILRDFGNRRAKEDPIVHFYEDFLHAYDPQLRELRGVYYTPEPVVRFITRAVDHLLQTEFQKPLGLADPTALILDPACGTGSFLYELIEQVYRRVRDAYGAGAWQGYVEQQLLPRVFGFELLVAPYAIAHLKLALQLQQLGYRFTQGQRLGVYLTNTLEQAVKRAELLLGEFIAREANDAAHIKREKPILVVLGNPPYSGHSANRSVIEQVDYVNGRRRVRRIPTWIGELLEDYKRVDGQPLQEKNPKWLQDDYVKFIRWGQWRIEQTGEGILAFITNHAYLDNPTFRGMRASLLRTFDRLYIVNLHGNARRNETAPDGSPDENVFDIQQGVAIVIAVKHSKPRAASPIASESSSTPMLSSSSSTLSSPTPTLSSSSSTLSSPTPMLSPSSSTLSSPSSTLSSPIALGTNAAPQVFYYDLWGRREAKYAFLESHELEAIAWTPLTPCAPMYLFVPQDVSLQAEYERGWRVPDIFPTHSVGIVTARDSLTIHWTADEVWRTVCRFVELEPEQARAAFGLGKDVRDWSVARAQADLRQAGVPSEESKAKITPILYRPFDVRYTFYTGRSRGFHCMPRSEVMRHLLAGENVALITVRSQSQQEAQWSKVFITRLPNEGHFNTDINYTFPLYLYSEAEAQGGLWSGGRRLNVSEGFLEALEQALTPLAPLSHEERWDERPSPSGRGVGGEGESILAYIYALLHAPSYRARYAEFLRRDFPRIPLPPSREAFDKLAALGQELIALHLLEHPSLAIPLCKFPVAGESKVERVRYEGGRVWINERQYFEPVPSEAWAFRVGGYQVCEKWLADRKGRTLSFDEILTYQRIVSALTKTVALQAQVDGVCKEKWGW